MKINVVNNMVQLEFPKATRTKAQEHALKTMIKENDFTSAIRYLKTFTQKEDNRYNRVDSVVRNNKVRTSQYDPLGSKPNNCVLYKFKRMFETSQNHTPIGAYQNWIGVEIECFIPYDSLDVDRTEECENCCGTGTVEVYNDVDETEDVTCSTCDGEGTVEDIDSDSSYRSARKALANLIEDNKIKHISLKSDGSIEPDSDYFPIEVTVLTKLDEPQNLEQVCKLLNDLGAKVNKSCGLHVHLDARHLDDMEVKSFGRNLGRALPVLAGMVPETRRSSTYCQLQVSSTDRYSAVNMTAYNKYKTVEVRLHSGTTNFKKIISWAKIIHSISSAPRIPHSVHSINELTEYVRIEENLVEYMTQRTALFSGENVQLEFQDTDESEAS